ncbi:hypothetical protein [Xanthobacter wiegelii]|uniref:hypothetical protein n=1 Tax=Xanthobacter wiegelii TaxID=3119913 RepID=UPI0037263E72
MVQSGPKQHSKIVDAMISHRLDRSDPGFSIRFGIFDEPGAPQPRNVTIAHLVVKRTRMTAARYQSNRIKRASCAISR